jgi:hypothetical protein
VSSGIVRNVPELEITGPGKMQSIGDHKRNTHIAYNARVFDFNRDFSGAGRKVKILVVGNSFARDFANVLLESSWADRCYLSYLVRLQPTPDIQKKIADADVIVFSAQPLASVKALSEEYGFEMDRVWNVGNKSFGYNNGRFYNRKRDEAYYLQRTKMLPGTLETNAELKREWSDRYIDLIALVVDDQGQMPVFTPDRMFYSQDCKHFTRSGAVEYAKLIDLNRVFGLEEKFVKSGTE